MKHKIKSILIPFMLLATLFFVTACSEDPTAYENNDANGYTVSVKYDANGGVFTGTSGIMVDSFNIADMEKDANGMVNLKLLEPTHEDRGKWDAANGSLVLAGWYKECTESSDSEGNKVYEYSGRFNFETDVVTVDPSKTYTSSEPVLTLYALWIPKFEVRFLDKETGEQVGDSYAFNPTVKDKEIVIQVPEWNQETGTLDMYKFPTIMGKTFEGAYYDKECTKPVTGTVDHPGKFNEVDGTYTDPVLNLYVDYTEGSWYHIYNAEQLYKNAKADGHYVLHADLDFTDMDWPAAFSRKFSGEIVGNGHTIKNVKIVQNNINRTEIGLFGVLMEGSKINDVTFENVTVSLEAGTRTPGAAFGVLAGIINKNVELNNVKVVSSKLQIADGCYWGSNDFAIGLLYGIAYMDVSHLDYSGVVCEGTGDKPVSITVDGNTVTIVTG